MNRCFSKVPLRLRAWYDIHKIVSAPYTQLFISFPGVYKTRHQCYLDAVTEKLLFAIGISWDLHDFCQRKINKYFHLHPLSLNDLLNWFSIIQNKSCARPFQLLISTFVQWFSASFAQQSTFEVQEVTCMVLNENFWTRKVFKIGLERKNVSLKIIFNIQTSVSSIQFFE